MIGDLSVLAIIPARGGSKGVPRKNIRDVAGRPLLGWTVAAAKASRYIDRLILSSDDDDIIAAARGEQCEVPFKRPGELARDETPGIDPVLHALEQLPGHDIVVLLQPTSPLRTAADIDGCLERMLATQAPACVSVRTADDHPYWIYSIDASGRMKAFAAPEEGAANRRQDLPAAWVLNGAVYAARTAWLAGTRSFLTGETVGFVMPAQRSLDIDTELDLENASRILKDGAIAQ